MPERPIFNSIDAFRTAARAAGKPIDDAMVRASFETEIKAAAEGERVLDFTISTGSVDRMGDVINPDGWKTAAYKRNPVVLWAHDASSMPVAKASNVRVEAGALKASAEFMPGDISRFADAVFRAIKAGFLSAVSVGFQPLKYAFAEDPGRRAGIDFLEQELLEFSVVPVPALAEALITGRSIADGGPFFEWARILVERSGLAVLPSGQLAQVRALPGKFRGIAKAIPKTAGAARSNFLRCANDVEAAIRTDGEAAAAPPMMDPAECPMPDCPMQAAKDGMIAPADCPKADCPMKAAGKAAPALALARRRLALLKLKIA